MTTNALTRACRLVPCCALALFANACDDRGAVTSSEAPAEVPARADAPLAAPPPTSAPQVSIEVWFGPGLVEDLAASLEPKGLPTGQLAVGDTFNIFVGYGIDIASVRQAATVERPWGSTMAATPMALSFGGPRQLGGQAPVPDSGYALARAFYDAMTNAREQSTQSGTSRDSPGGHVHCELSSGGDDARCSLTEVQRATFTFR